MYSEEIQNWLASKQYNLTSDEYVWMINEENNPQIDHILFDPYSNKYSIWTNDGYGWQIIVRKE